MPKPVPATAQAARMFTKKETDVTTPERETTLGARASAGISWRDIVQSGGDCAQIEGLALEQLIDHQRERARSHGEGR